MKETWYCWLLNNTSLVWWKHFGFRTFLEAWFVRARKCTMCGRWFLREGWWLPFSVNALEEHCSAKCSNEDIEIAASQSLFQRVKSAPTEDDDQMSLGNPSKGESDLHQDKSRS